MCGRPPGDDDVRARDMVALSNGEPLGDIPEPILSISAPSFRPLLASIPTLHQSNDTEWCWDETLLDEEHASVGSRCGRFSTTLHWHA